GRCPLWAARESRLMYPPGAGSEPVEAMIRVTAASEVLRHPNVNRQAMEPLANTSGGRLVELPDLASIPDQIKGETKHSFHHREATLWDNWLMLALVIGIYSLDVGLRRLTGLS